MAMQTEGDVWQDESAVSGLTDDNEGLGLADLALGTSVRM